MGTSLIVIPQPKKRSTAKADERAKKIEEAVKLTWDSMQSHLPYTHSQEELMIRDENKAFHKRCVKDYQRVITILTELY